MKRWIPSRVTLFSMALCALPVIAEPADFSRVQPILQKSCLSCHNAQMQTGGLALDSETGISKVIVPGKSADSPMMIRIASTQKGFAMPPIGKKLTADEIDTIRTWIDAGAHVTQASVPTLRHWAFEPIRRPATPNLAGSWPRNDIDRFVLARLQKEKLQPSPEADRVTLLRRITFDLVGLPPTPAEIAAFLADVQPGAYERVVDRLLDSPHYGERWARPWLDLAHYADSDGFEKDQVRPNAWRYRDWVIQALNADMPFDQFTKEQLAGDMLPSPRIEQRVATGFLRQNLVNREGGIDFREQRFEELVNRTNTIGTTWLGLTVGCAQCHNHKYDPISQKEYYQLMAFVENTEALDLDAPQDGETGLLLSVRPAYDRQRQAILDKYKIAPILAYWTARMIESWDNPGKDLNWDFRVSAYRTMLDTPERILKKKPAERTRMEDERFMNWFFFGLGADYFRDKDEEQRFQNAAADLKKLQEAQPAYSIANTIAESPDAYKGVIRVRGDARSPGEAVEAGTLRVLPPMPEGPHDRLALAQWLTRSDHPLVPRVFVNRAWQEFFGRGLVKTSEDFGTQGERPSHPELLDWLAAEFVSNFSMKKLHRTIVTSATYRQASHARPDVDARDPDNMLLARQVRQRLTTEQVRDATLSVSGLLNIAVGGRSVRPPLPAGVAELGYAGSVKWQETLGKERYRRGLYIHFQRTTPYPQLMNFDAPDMTATCARRRKSNSPLQSLNLLNDPVFFEAAQSMALRLLAQPDASDEDRLRSAFTLALARPPKPTELVRLSNYLNQQKQLLTAEAGAAERMMPYVPDHINRFEAAAWVGVSRVLLNLDEFITRE